MEFIPQNRSPRIKAQPPPATFQARPTLGDLYNLCRHSSPPQPGLPWISQSSAPKYGRIHLDSVGLGAIQCDRVGSAYKQRGTVTWPIVAQVARNFYPTQVADSRPLSSGERAGVRASTYPPLQFPAPRASISSTPTIALSATYCKNSRLPRTGSVVGSSRIHLDWVGFDRFGRIRPDFKLDYPGLPWRNSTRDQLPDRGIPPQKCRGRREVRNAPNLGNHPDGPLQSWPSLRTLRLCGSTSDLIPFRPGLASPLVTQFIPASRSNSVRSSAIQCDQVGLAWIRQLPLLFFGSDLRELRDLLLNVFPFFLEPALWSDPVGLGAIRSDQVGAGPISSWITLDYPGENHPATNFQTGGFPRRTAEAAENKEFIAVPAPNLGNPADGPNLPALHLR